MIINVVDTKLQNTFIFKRDVSLRQNKSVHDSFLRRKKANWVCVFLLMLLNSR
jgi:hypothetical protein